MPRAGEQPALPGHRECASKGRRWQPAYGLERAPWPAASWYGPAIRLCARRRGCPLAPECCGRGERCKEVPFTRLRRVIASDRRSGLDVENPRVTGRFEEVHYCAD